MSPLRAPCAPCARRPAGRLLSLVALGAVAVVGPSAAQAVPDGQSGSLSGPTALTDLAISPDGAWIAAADRDLGGLYLWDEAAYSTPVTIDGCTGAESIAWAERAGFTDRFYVGCADGVVLGVDVDGDTLPPTLDVGATITLNEGNGRVAHLAWASGDGYLHAVVQNGATFSIHRISLTSDTDIDGAGLPLSDSGTVKGLTVGADGGPVIVVQTNGEIAWLDRSGAVYAAQSASQLPAGTTTSLTTDSRLTVSAHADGPTGDISLISHATAGTPPSSFATGLSDPVALAYVYDGTELDLWIALQSGTIEVHHNLGGLEDTLEIDGGSPTHIAAAEDLDDPVYVAAANTVRVMSDRPWITGLTVNPTSVGTGDDFTLTFTSSESAEYSVRDDGPGPTDGSAIAAGTATADVEVSITLPADDLPREGDNRLFVFVEGAEGTGKDSVVVVKDTPPAAVTALVAEGGDEKLVVTWTSTDETDIDHYEVYLSDTLFTADTDPLPTFSVVVDPGGEDEETVPYPASVGFDGAETQHSTTLNGLLNDTVYYVAVRAIDEASFEGDIGEVVTGVPVQTCAASECAGDTYGCTCSPNSFAAWRPTSPATALVGLALGLGVVAGLRRRRSDGRGDSPGR